VSTGSTDIDVGIMGLAPLLSAGNVEYPFILDNLAKQGFINSRAFTLDLRSIDSPVGSVIFGGIDTGKYMGKLEKLPIIDLSASLGDRYVIRYPNGCCIIHLLTMFLLVIGFL
jgi:hypothetical protein